jgi:predicted permease
VGIFKFFRRDRWDEERARELDDYLAREIEDNLERGMPPDEAARAAHLKLGNRTRIREEIYEMNTLRLVEPAWHDLRFGLRLLRKNPTFAVVAILTLALGTGANAAIFQLVNAVRLRTLPVERPDTLVSVGIDMHGSERVGRGYRGRSFHTEPLWQQIRAQQQAFETLFAWGTDEWDLATEGELRPARGLYASGNYFQALGVRPFVGRVFTEADDTKGCGNPGAVLSHGFWQAAYGANPNVIGRTITLDRQPFDIIGVTPPGFFGVEVGRTFDVAVPLCAEPVIRGEQAAGTGRANTWWLDIMGRLEPDWTLERAQARLSALSPGIFKATVYEGYNAEMARNYMAFTLTAQPATTGVSDLRTEYSIQLWILLGATGLVLLITCANLANLMLARASAREREVAVRLAMGASRGRIIRQMLSESLLIALFGAAGGLLLARWLSQSLVVFLGTANSSLFLDLSPDWRVFAFITVLAIAACLIFGLSPAVKATGTNPGRAMQAGGRSGTEGREAFALRRGLVVLQVALSMVLIVGALLFARSLRNLAHVDLGFREEGIVSAAIDLRRAAVAEGARQQAFERIAARVRAVPGVRGAATTFIVPLSGSFWNQRIEVGGARRDGDVQFNQVSGEYFSVLNVPLIAGRTFSAQDRIGAPPAAIVNETFARRYFPNDSPLAQTFRMEATPGAPQPTYHIVGLAKDTKYGDLREEFPAIAYLALAQEPEPIPYVELVVRSEQGPGELTPALTRAIVEAAPGAAVTYGSITQYVRDSLVTERLMATLSGFFGVLAMLIAAVGLYGVMSYMVTRRKTEIGIRMALGADPGSVVRMVLRESGLLLVTGILIGAALAVAASRGAASLLYGLEPWDPASFAIAMGALALVSLLAAWIPARRAANLAPTIALRE